MGRNKLKVKLLAAIALCSSILAGCDLAETTRSTINERAENVKSGLDKVMAQGDAVRYDPLVVTDKLWAGDSALRIRRGIPLPPKYETEQGIAIVSAEPISFQEVVDLITQQTGIPVRVTDLSTNKSGSAASKTAALPQLPGGASVSAGGTGGAAAKGPSLEDTMMLSYEGSLSGLLERVAGNFGVSWKFDGSSILLSRFETRIFTVESLPGSQQFDASIQGGASSGGGGGGGEGGAGSSSTNSANMNAKTSVDLKYWDELSQVINSMLNGTGTVVMSPSLGTITVRTTPEIMQNVAGYLSKENERMTRQIAIDIEVYNVALENTENFNMTFSAIMKNLALKYNADSTLTPSIVGDAGAATVGNLNKITTAVLNPSTGDTSIGNTFSALSKIGNTSRVAQFPLVTMNNKPVSVRVGNDKTYVAKVEQSTSTGSTTGTTTVTVTTSQLSLGFSIQVIPRVLDDGRVLLQYALSSVDLVSLTPFSTGNENSPNTVQLPETTNRVFSQQSVLRSGSVLFIGGISQDTANQNAAGTGDPYNVLTGGSRSSNRAQTMMLISITPQVIDLIRSERG